MGKKPISKPKSIRKSSHSEISHQLKFFIKREFESKKPLDARLIRLKPNVIFKKGTMLPNLLIKMQGKVKFLGYFDFGEEQRLYFFDNLGQSLGAQNFTDKEKILNNLKGKGQTLYKLPKLDPNRKIDKLSSQIQEKFKKEVKRIATNYHLPFPEIPIISTLKIIENEKKNRFGIRIDDDILHIDKKSWQSKFQNFIFHREIFLCFFNLKNPSEELILLAIQWSLLHNSFVGIENKEYLQKIHHFKFPVSIKGFEWTFKNFLPKKSRILEKLHNQKLESLNSEQFLSKFFIFSVHSIYFAKFLDMRSFLKIFIFWLMKGNLSNINPMYFTVNRHIRESWIFSQLYYLAFENESILSKYKISLSYFGNQQFIEKHWYHYVIHQCKMKLATNSPINQNEFRIPLKIDPNKKISFQNFIQNVINRKLTLAFEIIPDDIKMSFPEMLDIFFEEYFKHYLLEIIVHPQLEVECQSSKKWEITLKNHGDWILHDVEYSIEVSPQSKATLNYVNLPNTYIFDTETKIIFELKTFDKGGKVTIKLNCSYSNHIRKDKKRNIILWKSNILIN